MAEEIYQFDPGAPGDEGFHAGELSLLAAGNAGRMLDERRTPVRLTAIDLAEGMFELQVEAFEDAGARWRVPFEDVAHYQFAAASARVEGPALASYEAVVRELDRELVLEVDPASRERTLARLRAERERARSWLTSGAWEHPEIGAAIAAREGSRELARACGEYLAATGLAEMDAAFAEAFVSNPHSGELVKGHAIVLAELGLCPYRGKVVRSQTLFAGSWDRTRRGDHLLARLGFTQALWAILGDQPPLFRASASAGVLRAATAPSFVSATFSASVAIAHFRGGPTTRTAAILRQPPPRERLFMTFLETPAMNAPYREAEAVLIGGVGERELF